MAEHIYFKSEDLIDLIDSEIEYYETICPDEGEGISEWDDGFISGMIKIKRIIRKAENEMKKRKQFEEALK